MADNIGSENTVQNQRMGKKGKILIACGIVVILALIAVIAILLFRGQKEEEPAETKRNVVVNQDNAEEVMNEMLTQEYVAPGYYSAAMTTTWHFKTGDAVSEDAYVANEEENTNDVYFDIFLADKEDTPIYQSPVIPRGSELERIKLDQALDAGTYDCVMVYHLVDEEQKTVSTLRVGFTIIVES